MTAVHCNMLTEIRDHVFTQTKTRDHVFTQTFCRIPLGKFAVFYFNPVKRRLPLSAQKLSPGSCPFITKAPLKSNLTNIRPVVNSYRNYLINFHWKSSNWFLRELSIGVGWINTP